jgi:hypothetical protein
LHAGTPLRYLSCERENLEIQRYQMFFGHFKVQSRVTSGPGLFLGSLEVVIKIWAKNRIFHV